MTVDRFFQQVKRALTFWAKGIITKKEVLDSVTLKKAIHYKAVLNESSGVTSTSYSKFSGDNWKDVTEDFARYVRGLQDGQFEEIIKKAQRYLKATSRRGVTEDSLQDSVIILAPRPRPAFSNEDSDEDPEENTTQHRLGERKVCSEISAVLSLITHHQRPYLISSHSDAHPNRSNDSIANVSVASLVDYEPSYFDASSMPGPSFSQRGMPASDPHYRSISQRGMPASDPGYRSSSLRREAAFYDFGSDRTPAWSHRELHGSNEDLVRQYYLVNSMMT
jgi:hypothetical protein